MNDIPAPAEKFRVVVNHEEQYSVWPLDREIPAGWRDAGMQGDKEACLAHVEEVWTDMRPLSVRTRLSGDAPEAEARA
ncbi:MbtH family NRPS accessory protein [Streptomyces albidoflavus]|uniref:MbtH family protein n=1 Tax=Streptomyces albidoflavus TaxID=1886 RepID=UPI000FF1257C|nr:MbtH family NRPS accessory protein [Streptomyces albidoflavus]RWZ77817.1 MbtH family NRPS accessory protein [Streptomyces albidoflavus]